MNDSKVFFAVFLFNGVPSALLWNCAKTISQRTIFPHISYRYEILYRPCPHLNSIKCFEQIIHEYSFSFNSGTLWKFKDPEMTFLNKRSKGDINLSFDYNATDTQDMFLLDRGAQLFILLARRLASIFLSTLLTCW